MFSRLCWCNASPVGLQSCVVKVILAGVVEALQFWQRGRVVLADVPTSKALEPVSQWLHRLPLCWTLRPVS